MEEQGRGMVTDSVYNLLKEMIFDWRLKPGQKINISYWSKELNISSIPLREALSRLNSTQLVIFEPNKGYRVSEILDDNEMLQLLEARILIEKHAVANIIRNNSTNITEELIEITNKMSKLDVSKSYTEVLNFIHLDQQFHSALLKKANNNFLFVAYAGMYSHFHIARFYRVRGGVDQVEATTEHLEIVDAIKTRDIYRAELAVQNHIKDAKKRLLQSEDNIYSFS